MSPPPKSKAPAWLHAPLYLGIRCAIAGLTTLPLPPVLASVSAAGRWFATRSMNRRRLARAEANLRVAFPEWDEERIRRVALDSYEHLFRLGVESCFGPRLVNDDSWARHFRVDGLGKALGELVKPGPVILLTGHCGNWELLGASVAMLGVPMHAVYRPLDLPPLDRYVHRTRRRRGLVLLDKFGAVKEMPGIIESGAPLGIVADQNGGDRGVFVPFFNRLAASYKSIGLLAMRYDARVLCAMARRVEAKERQSADELGYAIEFVDSFGPEDWSTQPDPLFYLTARYRRAIETMIRLAPSQYLWMHRTWRSRMRHERAGREFPRALEEKLWTLPWMTEADMAAIKANSAKDTEELRRLGARKLSME
ncbi:MAG: lysophospholipid acyltransferase family protein [Phycisphaerales bacterium]